jgi:hypothetical protein
MYAPLRTKAEPAAQAVRFKSPFHETPEGFAWHDREEQTVITETESRLRGEHGLGERKFHRAVPLSWGGGG